MRTPSDTAVAVFSVLIIHGTSSTGAGYSGALRLMSERRDFLGRESWWWRVAFFCTWCATAKGDHGDAVGRAPGGKGPQ